VKTPSDGYGVGYGRPPQNTRWKKGQSGNYRRRKPARRKRTLEMIDDLLTHPLPITFMGEQKIVSRLEAIIMQLMQKQMSGSARAARILLKYEEFANANMKKKLAVIFVENDYTRAFANLPVKDDHV
jgi:hypothetical protein